MVATGTFWAVLFGSVVLHWLTPQRFRGWLLAIVSALYLGSYQPIGVLALVGWAALFFYSVPHMGKEGWHRQVVRGLVLLILGQLALFKYLPPLLDALATNPLERDVVMPIGISYFTFKLIHYAIESGRDEITDRRLGDFLSYIFLFPIFTAGPIERYDHYLSNRDERLTEGAILEGLTRIVHGLVKKFFLADILVRVLLQEDAVTRLIEHPENFGATDVWWVLSLTFIYAYLDFSAYSDIAIGGARLFGIRILENFNWPILARNIGDFWKRWHMTLAGWCQTYVYMPTIGLTRQPYIAAYATFLAMGLWHGGSWNWVAWGTYHATGVATFLSWNRFKRKRKIKFFERHWVFRPLAHIATMMFVIGGNAFSATAGRHSVFDALRLLGRMAFLPV